MKKITVFTPTYNRAYLLPRLYESLCIQCCQDFQWLIIDDGSTDDTKELVEGWMNQSKISIDYIYKENGGMHTGHNLAYDLIETELNVCIDSDDYMPDDAVKLILEEYAAVKNNDAIAGLIGLDAFNDGSIVGSKNPDNISYGTLKELYNKYKSFGDKKIVLKTKVVKEFSKYPEFENERLVPLGILYLLIEQKYLFKYSNAVFCIVEYQEEGSSKSIFKQYQRSPRGFAYARTVQIKYDLRFTNKIKNYLHLISSAIFARDSKLMFKDVNPIYSIILFPFGLVLNSYIRFK